MNNIKEIIESLYNNFVLRDLYAKIIPGTIVIVSFLITILQIDLFLNLIKNLGIIFIIMFTGFTWIIGYSIQQLGEFLHFIKHHPPKYSSSDIRYNTRLRFKEVAKSSEIQQVERFAIIKEASGNTSTALFIVILLILIYFFLQGQQNFFKLIPLLLFLLLLSLTLLRANRNHAKKQYDFMEKTIENKIGIQIVVFDFDGVIVNSMPIQENCWKASLDMYKDEIKDFQYEGVLFNFWSGKSGDNIFEGLKLDLQLQKN